MFYFFTKLKKIVYLMVFSLFFSSTSIVLFTFFYNTGFTSSNKINRNNVVIQPLENKKYLSNILGKFTNEARMTIEEYKQVKDNILIKILLIQTLIVLKIAIKNIFFLKPNEIINLPYERYLKNPYSDLKYLETLKCFGNIKGVYLISLEDLQMKH